MPSFIEAVLVGAALGLSLAAPPGPVFAKVAHETARKRWATAILVGLGATSADATFFLLVWAGLLKAAPSDRLLGVLALGGVIVMDFFALEAWKAARAPMPPDTGRLSGFAGGYVIAATSPFNWLWWIGGGAALVQVYGLPLAFGFFPAIVAWVVLVVAFFWLAASRVPRLETYVSYASSVALAAFAVLLAYNGMRFLTS